MGRGSDTQLQVGENCVGPHIIQLNESLINVSFLTTCYVYLFGTQNQNNFFVALPSKYDDPADRGPRPNVVTLVFQTVRQRWIIVQCLEILVIVCVYYCNKYQRIYDSILLVYW